MNKTGWLIKNGLLIQDGHRQVADVLVKGDNIVYIGKDLTPPFGVNIIDATGCVVTYGLVDVHVHFREPGYAVKETIETGSKAAAHGGYTTVCAMPNLHPAPDAPETLEEELKLIRQEAVIDVRPYATITKGRKGLEVVDMPALHKSVVGFSDDGSGVQRQETMEEAMRQAKACDVIIAAHCEDNLLVKGGYIHDGKYAREHGHKGICSESEWGQIKRDVELAEQTGCRYHVCHVSTKESVEIIREAKKRGVKVTCETAPHYLVLTEDDLKEDGCYKMNPPLRSLEDQQALIEGLQDGTIDCIVTDHAPHTQDEKSRGLAGSAMGIVGLETAFPLMYTHLVQTGKLSMERLIELMCDNPRKIFRLGGKLREGQKACISIFEITTPYQIDKEQFLSKGRSTPFDGAKVYGRNLLTLYNGKMVWKDRDFKIKKKQNNDKYMKTFNKKLVLENGCEFLGYGFGADKECVCDLVFNTSMVGYQEIISDPSYTDQIVVMTYPLIGNYGINDEDFDSRWITPGGLIVREYCDTPSNFRYTKTFAEELEEQGIPGIYGFDTRKLTRIIRDEGTMRAAIVGIEVSKEAALERIKNTPIRHDSVKRVSCNKRWYSRTPHHKFNVVAIDCGIKLSMVHSLNQWGCNVTIVPFNTTSEEIMNFNPDGLFISNGPGSPEDVPEIEKTIQDLRGKLPIFGACLGHELIGMAYGAKVLRMKFAHSGANHPVKNLQTGLIQIVSQNHLHVIDAESIKGTPLEITHLNVLDNTVEGMECREDKVFSVQFFPDNSDAPRGCENFFAKFIKLMEENKNA